MPKPNDSISRVREPAHQHTGTHSGDTFTLYQIKAGEENHLLRFVPLSQLQEEALAFRTKVHTVAEDVSEELFADKDSVEDWLRSEGFVIHPNQDVGAITVRDDMQHESIFYLRYGMNCCHIDGCDTKALDLLVDAGRYEMVYSGPLPQECNGISERATILESIFYQMNMRRPAEYLAPSMSISDVVGLNMGSQTSYYFTDTFGFKELTDFCPKENPLRNAEMAMEDDYDMLDGIINNGPRQEEKAERPSVVDALKECSDKAERPHIERAANKEQER